VQFHADQHIRKVEDRMIVGAGLTCGNQGAPDKVRVISNSGMTRGKTVSVRLLRAHYREYYWFRFQMSLSSIQVPFNRFQTTTYLPSSFVICFWAFGASAVKRPISRATLPY
jgi:hypothetical protein